MDLASHPLVSTMHRLTEINQFFNLPVRELEGDGWIEATELFLGDDQRLRNLVMTYGQKAWGTTNNHVAGSVFIIAYLTRLVWPVIGQYVLQRRVPKVALDNVSFHCNSDGIDATALNHPWFAVLPGDPDADHLDSECVGDKTDLYERLEEWMFDSNLTPVIAALHRAAGASIKVSPNAVANSCTQAFHWLYSASKDPAPIVLEASTFFDERDSPVYGQVRMEVFEHLGKQGFFSRRRGCCLAWRTGRAHGYCSNCILLTKDQQDQQFRDLLECGG